MDDISNNLRDIGVEVDAVIARLGGNERLYLSICQKFLQDNNFSCLLDAFAAKDYIKTQIHIHTLKGVSANLGFQRLCLLCENAYEDFKKEEVRYYKQNISNISEEYERITTILLDKRC